MTELALILLKIRGTNEVAMQRRDYNTPHAPGMLGFFGGHIEANEKPFAAAIRELSEETSLDVGSLDIQHLVSVKHPADADGPLSIHLFEAIIPNEAFEVFEGQGCETYDLLDLLTRDDLAPPARLLLTRLHAA